MTTTTLPAMSHLSLQMQYYYYQQLMAANEQTHRLMLQRSQDQEAQSRRAQAMLQSVRQVIPSPERPGSVSSPSDSQSSTSSGSSSGSSTHFPSKILHSILSGHADRRDSENASPRSVSSTGSSYGGYSSPSPRSVDSPSPPTPATANKLYNLLKNPSSNYSTEDPWETKEPLNLKRKHSGDEPMDLSVKSKRSKSESDDEEGPAGSGSILESLLQGRRGCTANPWDSQESDTPTSPCPSVTEGPLASGSEQIVGLAKKVLLPVTARVSDWVVKIISYAQSLPQFSSLPCSDRVTLILNSWARLLLLCMAETGFEFAVSPKDCSDLLQDPEDPTRLRATDDLPTMRGVESVQGFIRKCQCLSLDQREYEYLKTITLFNPDATGLDHGEFVEGVFSSARAALQEHLKASKPSDKLRYSHILLLLPSLFSTNSRMMENLFCKHIANNTDMEVLLKEMMKKV